MIEGKENPLGRRDAVRCTPEVLAVLSDSQLLRRFSDAGDAGRELAFRELVDRHGPMVMGICRQVLRHPQDAEDAFQATFLVLVVKARSIKVSESLAPWLHGVACRTAQRARAASSRYRQDDRQSLEAIETTPHDVDQVEMGCLLHEELGRLPDKYRAPIVLCHLGGKTHEEAARVLRWPVGTVSGRLSRGRRLLKARLERRGVPASSAFLVIPWLNLKHSLSISSIESALDVAMRFPSLESGSAYVLSLTRGVLKAMLLNRLKTVSLAVLVMSAVSAGVWAHMPSHSSRQTLQASAAASTSGRDVLANSTTPANSPDQLSTQSSADCPLANTADLPPYCPISMAASAVTKVMAHFHGSGSTSAQ
jgi:HlyD family secretion protein